MDENKKDLLISLLMIILSTMGFLAIVGIVATHNPDRSIAVSVNKSVSKHYVTNMVHLMNYTCEPNLSSGNCFLSDARQYDLAYDRGMLLQISYNTWHGTEVDCLCGVNV